MLVKSYRIREDLITDIEYPDFFKSKLVVRKFVPVDISMEFRAFVSKGKITALSQYESGLYFRKLAPKKDSIQHEILALFEKIKDKIRLQSYVLDLAIVDDKGKPTASIYILVDTHFLAFKAFEFKNSNMDVLYCVR